MKSETCHPWKRARALIVLLVCLGTPCLALDEPVSLIFSAVGAGRITDELTYNNNGHLEPIQLYDLRKSGFYRYHGDPLLSFYLPATEPGVPPVLAAQVIVPPGLSEGLVLFAPAPADHSLPYRAWLLNDSIEAFPNDIYRFVNLSSWPVRMKLGEAAPVEILPGKSADIPPVFPEGRPYLTLQMAAQVDGDWQLMGNRKWRYRPDYRNLVLLVPNSVRVSVSGYDTGGDPEPLITLAIVENMALRENILHAQQNQE